MVEPGDSGFGVDVSMELAGLVADRRLVRRAQKMLNRWQEKPGLGFPEVYRDSAELEAAYRFYGNASLTFDKLVQPHTDKSVERCGEHGGDVLCIHDTSTFVFGGDREGLGFINKNNRGFLGHFALAVSRSEDGEAPLPLGVVAATTWVRTASRKSKGVPQHQLRSSDDCESHRWLNAVVDVERRFEGIDAPIHVMDREGDIYDVLSTMVANGNRFVVRALSNRKLESDDADISLLFDALEGLEARLQQTICVAPRKASRLPDQRAIYPARAGRSAEVCVTATPVTLKRTRNSSNDYPATTPLHVVHIFEPNPPKGQAPVEWVLLTSEPISTDAELLNIIGIYRQRWLIEEFFKAIKTGCAFEKRQLGSYGALANALAMTLPLAWEMLLLRAQSRTDGSLPAARFISPLRLEALSAYSKRAKRYPLPDNPTLRDVAYAIAGLGGHLKRNGPPGWQTLRRGFEQLLAFEEGWLASTNTYDQS
mgnify:CR=1 FL=1